MSYVSESFWHDAVNKATTDLFTFGYKNIIKPNFVFNVPPDQAHDNMITFCKVAKRMPPLMWACREMLNYTDPVLETEVMGVKFANPFGLSAGLDKNCETPVLMDNVGNRMDGVSLHYYTVSGWDGSKGSATQFDNDQYYWTLGKCLEIEDVIKRHCTIMDEKDPKKHIGLLVDEWGTWWDEEPGTIGGHLYQQNALRDAFVASLSLNVFHKYTDRVRMANIAQVVNVLQSMILTDTKGTGHMVLTPTYHVFEMYQPFQEATYLPLDLKCENMNVRHDMNKEMNENNKDGFRTLPLISASAAKTTDGSIVISLSNVSLDKNMDISVNLNGMKAKSVDGRILTSKNVADFNDFDHPTRVSPVEFKGAKLKKDQLTVKLPAKSIVVLQVK